MSEAPIEIVKVIVAGREVELNPANMKYNENTLAQFMNIEYGWVDYLGKQLEYAQKEVNLADIDVETVYSQKFLESKDAGNSDNYAKAYANSHQDVVKAKKYLANRKEAVGHLKAHLKAWKDNHESVICRSHDLRAEMKLLNRDSFEDQTCCAEDFLKENENNNSI